MHLVLYDGKCGFCSQAVRFLLKIDKKKTLTFAPLQGEYSTKLKTLDPYRSFDTLIFIENHQNENMKIYLFGAAFFRILWIIGGIWAIPGSFSFLPSFLYDAPYRWVARHRHLIGTSCEIINPNDFKDRFLP